jgi:outer membrane protein assembly factor BamB
MMASPVVADGMIFAASNKKAYYGINATTGHIEWTFKDDDADEFIICSPIYHDGVVYLVDQFFVVAVNAFSGQTLWSTFLGAELYVSPTYADGKLYVTTDQRSIYVLNATNGEKLSYFGTSSNSWSSPTLYEGKLYVGNNDWNVYCLSEYLALNSSVIVELANFTVVLGESVTGFGRLVPRMANASIVISFVKPDGAEIDMAVVTSEKGVFSFSYTPAVVGNWTVVAHWQPTKGYYAPAFSEHLPLEVAAAPTQPDHTNGLTEMPMEYIYAFVTVIVIITAALLGYLYMKRTRK